MRRTAALIALFACAVSAQSAWTIYLRRAGDVRIGFTLPQVREILKDPGANLVGNDPDVPLQQCAYLESAALPGAIGLMFEAARLVRVDITEPGIRTASGIQVGDSEERVKQVYGRRITVGPHKYDPDGHYLTYTPVDDPDRPYRLLFETDGKTVTEYRIGTIEAVALVEGCS